jgi:transcriptional antiterminator RfaH
MQRAWPYSSRACRLEPSRHSSHKLRLAVGVDRRGQRVQHGEIGVGEGQRHAGVSAEGDLTRRYRSFAIDRRYAIARTRPMPAFWGVVRSLPKREAFAAERLRMDHGFEVFLPLVQTKRASAQLFSGYSFCRIVDRWRSINSTFGVLCLVRVGDCPARCPDREIDSLKAMIDGRGFVRLPEAPPPPVRRQIAIGARVRIAAGPFGGMSGLYAGQSTRERELVLLNVLGGQRPVAIAANLVIPQ